MPLLAAMTCEQHQTPAAEPVARTAGGMPAHNTGTAGGKVVLVVLGLAVCMVVARSFHMKLSSDDH